MIIFSWKEGACQVNQHKMQYTSIWKLVEKNIFNMNNLP